MHGKRWVIVGVPLLLAVAGGIWWSVSGPGRAPQQPIAFSHATHAGKRQISCVYCHQGVATSAHATLPSTQTCVECHRVVRTDHPEVQKVLAAYQQKEVIRWVRVVNLPDYVRFTHQRHIKAGVQCIACHGDVAKMERVSKAHALTMGECLQCHNARRASTDCFTCHF